MTEKYRFPKKNRNFAGVFIINNKNSMKYIFKIVETYSKRIEIEAESEDEAFERVHENYETGHIKFDVADDFDEWEIFPDN